MKPSANVSANGKLRRAVRGFLMVCKGLAAASAVTAGFCQAALASDYHLIEKFKIGGDGGWDYLTYDAPSDRLFITRGDRVQVVNPTSGNLLAEIMDTPGVHGVALANELGKGYTSNGRDNSITVFDLKTLKTLNKVKTVGGENPDFIVYDGVSRRVLALNGKSHNASVIDAANDQLLTTIALTGKPEAAVADGNGRVFVNIEDRDELATIDMRKGVVTGTWSLPGCHEPAGLAIDTGHHRLFVGCHNRALLVVDSGQGRVVATLPIGEGVDANAFDAASGLAFSSQGDGTLSIVKEESADTFSVQQTATTQHGARTMALNPNNHRVYLVSADFEETPATTGHQRPRRVMKPNSFALLVMGSQ